MSTRNKILDFLDHFYSLLYDFKQNCKLVFTHFPHTWYHMTLWILSGDIWLMQLQASPRYLFFPFKDFLFTTRIHEIHYFQWGIISTNMITSKSNCCGKVGSISLGWHCIPCVTLKLFGICSRVLGKALLAPLMGSHCARRAIPK